MKNHSIGIDVSRYQTDVDWTQVSNDGNEFVIIRGGGGLTRDPLFDEHVYHAKDSGLLVAVYWFLDGRFDSYEQGKKLAQYTNEHCDMELLIDGKWQRIGWLDVENWSGHTLDPRHVAQARVAFMQHAADDVTLGIYTSQSSWNSIVNYDWSDHPLWVANYVENRNEPLAMPSFWKDWHIWQWRRGEDDPEYLDRNRSGVVVRRTPESTGNMDIQELQLEAEKLLNMQHVLSQRFREAWELLENQRMQIGQVISAIGDLGNDGDYVDPSAFPLYSQNAPQWKHLKLAAATSPTFSQFGCLICAFAMIENALGGSLNPVQMRDLLRANGKLSDGGTTNFIHLPAVSPLVSDEIEMLYDKGAWSDGAVRWNMMRRVNNVVGKERFYAILLVDATDGGDFVPHFVVAFQQEHNDLQIADPRDGQIKTLLTTYPRGVFEAAIYEGV